MSGLKGWVSYLVKGLSCFFFALCITLLIIIILNLLVYALPMVFTIIKVPSSNLLDVLLKQPRGWFIISHFFVMVIIYLHLCPRLLILKDLSIVDKVISLGLPVIHSLFLYFIQITLRENIIQSQNDKYAMQMDSTAVGVATLVTTGVIIGTPVIFLAFSQLFSFIRGMYSDKIAALFGLGELQDNHLAQFDEISQAALSNAYKAVVRVQLLWVTMFNTGFQILLAVIVSWWGNKPIWGKLMLGQSIYLTLWFIFSISFIFIWAKNPIITFFYMIRAKKRINI